LTFDAGGILHFNFGPREPCLNILLLCNTSSRALPVVVNDPKRIADISRARRQAHELQWAIASRARRNLSSGSC
jgi:hypothetical protein